MPDPGAPVVAGDEKFAEPQTSHHRHRIGGPGAEGIGGVAGAARGALGPDLPALFTPDDALAADLLRNAAATADPLWRLPLWAPYRELLDSKTADINNISSGALGGAITAALFLAEFVTETPAWAHIDMMAWNATARPGRPVGGEAMCLRALFALIEERFC